jgi:hypothetical protein
VDEKIRSLIREKYIFIAQGLRKRLETAAQSGVRKGD